MKLIFLDIDGTLTVAGSNTPPASAMEAVHKTQEKGNKVFLCTGRNLGMAEKVYELGFDGIIALAGAYVLAGDEVIYEQSVDNKELNEIITVLHDNGVFCTIEAKDRTYGDEDLSEFLQNADGDNSEIERWRKALSEDLGILPMKAYDGEEIYKIVIMARTMEQLDEAREKYEENYEFVVQEVKQHGNCINGELVHRSFNKGKAIRLVADYYGVDMKDTYGFGDSMNDLTMIETVGVSACMGNGAQALKQISDFVLEDVDNDGLYKGFETLGLL